MSKVSIYRSIVWLSLCGFTLTAINYSDAKISSPKTASRIHSMWPKQTAIHENRSFLTDQTETSSTTDPFAPRPWQVKPSVAAPAEGPSISPPISQPIPAATPPLPFKFMGRIQEAGKEIVYLSRGTQMIVARIDEVIDDQYKIVNMSNQQIEFEYLPTHEKQALLVASEGAN